MRATAIHLFLASFLLSCSQAPVESSLLATQESALSQRDLDYIDNLVTQVMALKRFPGLSLAIAKDGRLVFAKGYGKSDIEAGTPVTTDSRFRIASVSKPITAAAIMKLVEQGKIKLGDLVFGKGAILGETYGAESYYSRGVTKITIQNLLEHTAGGWEAGPSDPMLGLSQLNQAELISRTLQNVVLKNEPGTNYAYSNFGYCILGRVIEAVTKTSYEDFVRTAFLVPAGIKSMSIAGNTLAQRKENEVKYYHDNNYYSLRPYELNVTRMDSHGGWIATPTDLLRWMVRVDGFPTKPDFLTSSTIALMTSPGAVNPAYAKGWNLAGANWFHAGFIYGNLALLVRTGSGFSWAVMVNGTMSEADVGISNLDRMMWDIVNGVQRWPDQDLF